MYVHPNLAAQGKKWSVQVAAEVTRNGSTQLETFMLESTSASVAAQKLQSMQESIKQYGRIMLLAPNGVPKYTGA